MERPRRFTLAVTHSQNENLMPNTTGQFQITKNVINGPRHTEVDVIIAWSKRHTPFYGI